MAAGSLSFPIKAMVLAAGLGTRMRPLSDECPKPLLEVCGRSLLDRILDSLAAAGVDEAVINAYHLGEQIDEALAGRQTPACKVIHEATRLETGGGVKNALPFLGSGPFLVINGDVLWQDGADPAPARLAAAWDEASMDALLLLQPVSRAVGYDGQGDFFQGDDGCLTRRAGSQEAPYVFAGVQILSPSLFDGLMENTFSLNLLYDAALLRGRLYGLVHDGQWFHVGTPQNLEEATRILGSDASGSSLAGG